MNPKDEKLRKKLLETFRIEAKDNIKTLSSGLHELESEKPGNAQDAVIEKVFREAHSLKGAARAVNFITIETLCHSMESVFSALKKHRLKISPDLMDVLFQSVKIISRQLSASSDATGTPDSGQIEALSNKLVAFLQTGAPDTRTTETGQETVKSGSENQENTDAAAAASEKSREEDTGKTSSSTETVRIATKKINTLMRRSEEMISVKQAMEHRISEINELRNTLEEWQKDQASVSRHLYTLKSKAKNSDTEPGKYRQSREKLISFLDLNETRLASLEKQIMHLGASVRQDHYTFSSNTDIFLDDLKQLLLQPVSTLLDILPETVRELSRQQKKKVELVTSNTRVQIDRRILEELKSPLLHIVRNCIDHGIEEPSERARKGKKEKGVITIETTRIDSKSVEIRVSDDGGGIDLEKIRSRARKMDLITGKQSDEMDEIQIQDLVFQSGVSSGSEVTDISGRGLGLAIVREKVENMGGTVSMQSDPETGTTFRIQVPLTLSTFRGILVGAGDQMFVISTVHVAHVYKTKKDHVKTVGNKQTISHNEEVISLLPLADALGISRTNNGKPEDDLTIIIISHSGKKTALIVDELLGEQEIMLKAPGKQLSRLKNISGVTVMGDGKIVPVINVGDLMQSTSENTSPKFRTESRDKEKKRPAVLLAEDSITARTLLKNILETEGYQVTTAVDGTDAYTKVMKNHFDILISDVDMPGMSGFELTQKIRSNKDLASLPVVLVTSLDSNEDKKHGIEAGADSYIVKGSFDQSNLLQAIQQLL